MRKQTAVARRLNGPLWCAATALFLLTACDPKPKQPQQPKVAAASAAAPVAGAAR